jgi:hypothetical protein
MWPMQKCEKLFQQEFENFNTCFSSAAVSEKVQQALLIFLYMFSNLISLLTKLRQKLKNRK